MPHIGDRSVQHRPGVRPQDDLYQHVNGAWLKATDIPDDRPLEGTFTALRDGAEIAVREIIEEAAAKGAEPPGVERQDGRPLQQLHGRGRRRGQGHGAIRRTAGGVFATTSTAELVALAGRLFRADVPGLFYIYPAPDAGNPERVLLYIGQGGLGLPDESYYREEKFAAMVAAYREHVGTMFGLAGVADAEGAAGPGSGPRNGAGVAPLGQRHPPGPAEDLQPQAAEEAAGLFPLLATWFEAAGIAPPSAKSSWSALRTSSPGRPRSAVPSRCRLAGVAGAAGHQRAAPYLSAEFVDANFAFYGTTLSGTPRNKDRWKREWPSWKPPWVRPSARSTWPSTSPKRTRPGCRPWWPT